MRFQVVFALVFGAIASSVMAAPVPVAEAQTPNAKDAATAGNSSNGICPFWLPGCGGWKA
ncbi:hypothetical protein FRB91_005578 [Serendipita sp. 411]|nr:hypothetical protein FRC15_007320 [Serendipita sp. 397]KAG8768267.1 hypothetical protein FRC16_007100 [Serendipita sp. 398]KAG8804305.1 hypothetical protein FRC18_007139 [Serendipita sp. 400]KAG8815510.1 hypothetical protein FRC19_000986 [Serendipita sp. 401]KAG8832490.1 hypothetical protein FRC20_007890 [Serendipita sp. 405]KAG8853011.1 hypothetical protein FRB91_005578 [Serendipita sp. 411]